MDIEGAFDNASYQSMEKALFEINSNPIVTKWVGNLLSRRQILANLGNEDIRISTVKGCPQGGVLSPLLWSILVDNLLVKLNNSGFTTVGYADDITIIVNGKHDDIVVDQMQKALKLTWEWCECEGLSINPNKTTIIPFSRRLNIDLPTLYIKNSEVNFKEEVKYLGIILDKKLTWGPHLDSITRKSIRSIWATRQLLGKTWGLSPKMSMWIYRQMIMPTILYGSVIWWEKTNQVTSRKKLSKIQRMACLNIIGAMRTTPTIGMEAILNLEPLHIAIQGEAVKQALDLHRIFRFKEGDHRGHLKILNMVNSVKNMTMCSDQIEPVLEFNRNYKVLIPSRIEWNGNPVWLKDDTQKWFTDGSKTLNGVGAGIYGPGCKLHIPLSKESTIFTAELYAIYTAIHELKRRNLNGVKISLASDSQAVIKALCKRIYHHKSVLECHNALNGLAELNNVTLIWVPGHSGHIGNEKADELARRGAEEPFIGPYPQYGFTKKDITKEIENWMKGQAERNWLRQFGIKHSKKFLSYDRKRSGDALGLNRSNLRLLCGALTGHYTCNYHLHKMHIVDDPMCNNCLEEKETMEHIIAKCPAFANQRHRIFGRSEILADDYKLLAVKDIVTFLNKVYKN